MDHFFFALYLIAIVTGIVCSMSLRPLRVNRLGLSEALVVNWLLSAFTLWGAVILYAAVNLDLRIDVVRILLVGIGFILSGLTIYLPRQVEATFSLPARFNNGFKLLALLSILSTVSALFFTTKASLWLIAMPIFSLIIAVGYSQAVHTKNL